MLETEDPFHKIIDRPWEYEISGFNFQTPEEQGGESYLDLTLRKGDVTRHLRFYSPQDIEVEKGFPMRTGGLAIYDVSSRGLNGLGVRVDDFEASWGKVRFWARDVIDLDGG